MLSSFGTTHPPHRTIRIILYAAAFVNPFFDFWDIFLMSPLSSRQTAALRHLCSRCVLSGEMDRMRGRACAEPPYGTSCFVCWICFSFCRLSTPRRMRCDGKMKFWLHFFVFRQKDSIFAHPFQDKGPERRPESWVSGWNHQFAKLTYGITVPGVRIPLSPQ